MIKPITILCEKCGREISLPPEEFFKGFIIYQLSHAEKMIETSFSHICPTCTNQTYVKVIKAKGVLE